MLVSARVRDVRAGVVRLECETSASCQACAGGRGCALRWLAPGGRPSIEVPHSIAGGVPLSAGQSVRLEVADSDLIAAAARVYLVPLAGLLAGPALAQWVSPASEARLLLAAVAGLMLGWLLARSWLRRSPPRYSVHAGPLPDDR